jgi:hypothetical protein
LQVAPVCFRGGLQLRGYLLSYEFVKVLFTFSEPCRNLCETVAQYQRYLKKSGFEEVDGMWQYYWLAVYVAHKLARNSDQIAIHPMFG